jgi:hypothetical protein
LAMIICTVYSTMPRAKAADLWRKARQGQAASLEATIAGF